MNFRTQIPVADCPFPIDYHARILSAGSCFAENIGNKLAYHKFDIECNPFGILFHPRAIDTMFQILVTKKYFTEKDLFYYQDRWHSFDAHSQCSHPDKEQMLTRLNTTVERLHNQFSKLTHIIITLGTAWEYRFKETGNPVANCHKVPQTEFTKELLMAEDIVKVLKNTIDTVREVNQGVKIIFTISPVRHLKDGFVENQVSKSQLITALYTLLQDKKYQEYAYYFPSYEIVIDELRDYRFYSEDMLHPNTVAVDYIWERFSEKIISAEEKPVLEEIAGIQKSLAHRPFNPEGEAHQKFLENLSLRIQKVKDLYPHISFDN